MKRKNITFLLGMFIGILITGITVYASSVINGSDVSYNNTNSGLTSSNVQTAIDELYTKADKSWIGDIVRCSIEGGRSCTITNMKVEKNYFCVNNYRGVSQKLSVNGAQVIYSAEMGYYFDGVYSTNRSYIKPTSSSVTFTISSTSGMDTVCYHILNSK